MKPISNKNSILTVLIDASNGAFSSKTKANTRAIKLPKLCQNPRIGMLLLLAAEFLVKSVNTGEKQVRRQGKKPRN